MMLSSETSKFLAKQQKKLSDVQPDVVSSFPSIDLRTMYATRNRMIHAYAFINFAVIYEIALQDIPACIAALEDILADWPSDLT